MSKNIYKFGVSVVLLLTVFIFTNLNCVYAQENKSDYVFDTDLWYDVEVDVYDKAGSLEYLIKSIVDKDSHTVYFYIDCITDTKEPVPFYFSLDIYNEKNKYENIVLAKNMKHENFDFTLNIQKTMSKNGKPNVFALKFKNKEDYSCNNNISISVCFNKNNLVLHNSTYSVSNISYTAPTTTIKNSPKTTEREKSYTQKDKTTKFYSEYKSNYSSKNKSYNQSSKYYGSKNDNYSSYEQTGDDFYDSAEIYSEIQDENEEFISSQYDSKMSLGSKILVGVGIGLVIASFTFVFYGISKNRKAKAEEKEKEKESSQED